MFSLFVLKSISISDSDPLVTQDMVDKINNNPDSPFKAKLYPKFAKMTRGDVKKFLSPIRPAPKQKGSAYPVGADESQYTSNFLAIKFNGQTYEAGNPYNFGVTVYDVSTLCSSWAPAATSAVSLSVSRWASRYINFSLQFVLDCDMLGDACVERPSLSAYQLFWNYKIPEAQRWDQPGVNSGRTSVLQAPVSSLTQEICKGTSNDGCYPGTSGCSRSYALTGSCNPGDSETTCPLYFLYNWRWIKSHLWEVGPVTSSILVYSNFFTYDEGVYTSADDQSSPLGMLDVTIIGWGENTSAVSNSPTESLNRWWYVIPHLGSEFGIALNVSETDKDGGSETNYTINNGNTKGFMKFNRRFDDCMIESQAIGPVPYNFVPTASS